MTRYHSLALLALLATLPNGDVTAVEPLGQLHPEQLGVSSERLQTGLQLFRDAIDKDELRNAEIMVLRDGHVILHEALGWQNKEAGVPLPRHTLFRMASNTKAVIAAGILLLEQEGKLDVRDAVGKHLPAFNNAKCRDMTIHQLLTHTSGLRIKTLFLAPLMKPTAAHPNAPTLQLEVDRFAKVGPREVPGTTYQYNNPGYNILAAVIEVVSGQPLETFLTARLYRPLNMVDTTNRPPADKLERMAHVYARKDGKWTTRFKQETRMHIPFIRGSGGLVSTTSDFARFCLLYIEASTRKPPRLLTPASATKAFAPQTRALFSQEQAAQQAYFYGYGWRVARDGSVSHSGSEGTYAWIHPRQRIIGLVFTQSPGGKNPRDQFRQIVTAACGDLPRNRPGQ